MRTTMKKLILASLLLCTVLLAAGASHATALYFSHVDTTYGWQTEIAIINTSPTQSVTGTLRALSNQGQLVETKAVTLPTHGRRQITVANEFTNHTSIRYIVFEADSDTVKGYTKFFIEGFYRAAIPAVKEINISDIYVPHIDSGTQWWTGISLVNTTSVTKNLTITFSNGQTCPISLNANTHTAFTIGSLFNNQPQPDIHSAVIANANGVIGLELFGTLDGKMLEGILLSDKTASTLYYPHVDSSGWWTGIVAYNPWESTTTLTITPYSVQGTPLTTTTLPLASKAKYVGTVDAMGLPSQTAWFRIDSTLPLTGFELFGTSDGNQLAAYANSGGTGAKEGVFAKVEKNGWTGIAFVNTEDSAASVTLTAYNDNGTTVATQVLFLNSHAKYVGEVVASNATYIAYTSDKNVVGFQLDGSADLKMLDGLSALGGTTALPVIASDISLTKVTVLGVYNGIAYLSIPFNSNIQASKIINVVLDLNNDGRWANYVVGGVTQQEWIVTDMPARVLTTEMNIFTFDVNDLDVFGRIGMRGRVILTDEPIESSISGQWWDGNIPADVIATKDFVISRIDAYDPGELWTPDPELSMDIPIPVALQQSTRSDVIRKDVAGCKPMDYHRSDVPHIKQKTGECVPTATAMSLLWLADQHKFKDRLPKDDKTLGDNLIEALKRSLGAYNYSRSGKGVKVITEFVPGMNDFINSFEKKAPLPEQPPLPLEVHIAGTQNDANLFDKIAAELQKGQDIELDIIFGDDENTVNSAHMLTVVGATCLENGKGILEVYDPKCDRPNAKTKPLDKCEVFSGNKLRYKLASRTKIRTAFAISPKKTTSKPVSLVPKQFDFKYYVGSTCPQYVGTLAIASTTGEVQKWSMSQDIAWLDRSETSGITPAVVELFFNCITTTPGNISGTIEVAAINPETGEPIAGSQESVTVTGTIEPQTGCPGLPGTYAFAVTGITDPAEHSAFVGMPFAHPVSIAVTGSTITITGQPPFVGVSGMLASDCSFTATGKGTVAGFPNVSVIMKGTYNSQTGIITATYEMGSGGELPQGKSIIYSVTGHK